MPIYILRLTSGQDSVVWSLPLEQRGVGWDPVLNRVPNLGHYILLLFIVRFLTLLPLSFMPVYVGGV
jgi:hypothetical protein